MKDLAGLKRAADYILSKTKYNPQIGMVLGSGLGVLAEEIEDTDVIDYSDIPGFPVSTVEGHAGKLVIGMLKGKCVLVLQGRFHYYEGYDMDKVVFPIRVMLLLGIKNLLVTNAAGGIPRDWDPGDLMLITDHINFTAVNPLRGENISDFGPRFNDMSTAYTPVLQDMAREVSSNLGITLREGVYVFMGGPSFETPAEIRMVNTMGGHAVGMSTVPEVVVAAHGGMNVLGLSCISNMAAGILDQPLNHQEVIDTGKMVREKFLSLVKGLVNNWD
ncbi:MAG: purine-nucleoside phosphorylase [Spirochaetales bacterium]|nr:purine-nucleoside phosphorylase [Spirochaetales bacterium]